MHQRSPFLRGVVTVTLAAAVAVPLGLSTASSADAAKVIDGPDVASYQHPHPTKAYPHGQPINWNAVRKSGKDFAIVKASEGTSYVNPDFAGPYFDDYANAAAAGLVHGAYHYARPATPIVASANAQAKLFARVVGKVRTPDTLPPALDLETTGGLGPAQLITWAQVFLLKMRDLTGRTPMLYTYPSFWTSDLGDQPALARYPLWMAHYGTSKAPTADLWQYTSTARVKGIKGNVDLSRFIGSSGFPWETLSDGTVHTKWPLAPPGAPVSPIASISGTTATVHWLPGDTGSSRITKYVVRASPGHKTQTVTGTKFAATFSNLSPNTSYTFTVTPVNDVDAGTTSRPTNAVVPTVPTALVAKVAATVPYDDSLPIRATLTRTDTDKPLVDRPVLLFRQTATSSAWQRLRKLRTDDNGRVATVLHPKQSATIELVFPGKSGLARSSIFKSVIVRPTVTSALSSSTVAHGSTATLTGTVTPALAGQKVIRQRLVNDKWVTRGTTRVTRRGTYSFTLRPKVAGTYVLRDVVPATAKRGSGLSPRVTLTAT